MRITFYWIFYFKTVIILKQKRRPCHQLQTTNPNRQFFLVDNQFIPPSSGSHRKLSWITKETRHKRTKTLGKRLRISSSSPGVFCFFVAKIERCEFWKWHVRKWKTSSNPKKLTGNVLLYQKTRDSRCTILRGLMFFRCIMGCWYSHSLGRSEMLRAVDLKSQQKGESTVNWVNRNSYRFNKTSSPTDWMKGPVWMVWVQLFSPFCRKVKGS